MKPGSRRIISDPAPRAVAGGVLLLLVVSAGCGGGDSTASKSAAEFDRAQSKGGADVTTGSAHGGHGGDDDSPTDRAEADASAETAGMDHSNMPGMKPAGGTPTQGGLMAGMDHSNMRGMATALPIPEKPAVSAQPGQPEATLRPGDLDRPAPTSLRDAARAAAMTQEMAGVHRGMVHGTYSQTDAGRDEVPVTSPKGKDRGGSASPQGHAAQTGHESHGAVATPAQPVAPDPHAGHRTPAPQPTPTPSPSPVPKEKQ
jgi:hypothetical protein